MDKDNNRIRIESESSPGTFYSVDTTSLTCSCPIFVKKLRVLPLDNPHRLCKHLVQAIAKAGIPSFLTKYKSDIEWFAQQKASFTDRDSVRRTKKLALPVGSVQSLATNKKRKYCYSEAIADGKKISAAIPLQGGMVSYTISNLHASYDTMTQESFIPTTYRNLEEAIVAWIVDEYNKVKHDAAPSAVKKQIDYQPIEDELPEDSVKTVSTEKKTGLIEFYEIVDNFDEAEYFHIRGQAGRESVEAIIRKNYSVILYNIDGSKVYTYDVAPTKEESNIPIVGLGKVTMTFSSDLSDTFPKTYWFLEKAVLAWLKSEYDRISRNKSE
jgi:hypothetical protein